VQQATIYQVAIKPKLSLKMNSDILNPNLIQISDGVTENKYTKLQ